MESMEGAGDRKEAETLLAHTGWMRSLALSLVRDPSRADDLVQDTLVAAIERQYAVDKSLGAWLAGILRNLATLEFRTASRRRRREALAARREATACVSDIVERADLHRRLVEEVLRLEEPYLSAVLLRYFDGMKPAEIARQKRVPESTVRTWLSRGIEKLRRSLEPSDAATRESWRSGLLSLAGLKHVGSMTVGVATSGGSAVRGLALGGTIVKAKVLLVSSILACAGLVAVGAFLMSRREVGSGQLEGVDRLQAPGDFDRAELSQVRGENQRERDLLLKRIADLEEELRAAKASDGKTEAADRGKGEDLPPVIQTALQSWRTLLGSPERFWGQLHSDGDLEKMEEFTATVGTLIPWKLANEELSDAERVAYERLLDVNGFRQGYVKFAKGELTAAAEALEAHIEHLDKKEAELAAAGRELDPVSRITRDHRSKDVLGVLREMAGRPAAADFNLGDAWLTEKRVLVAESRGKVLAIVFRQIGDERSGAFLGPLSREISGRPAMDVLTLSWLKGDDNLEGARERLLEDLARFGYQGAAGLDPDALRQSLFRRWRATVGTATFMILDREGRLAWYMPDPRGIDVRFATKLLDSIAGAR